MGAGETIAILGALGLAAWFMYLHHKQTLRMLEACNAASETLLRMRERWRLRQGMLAGAILIVLGGAAIAFKQELVLEMGPPQGSGMASVGLALAGMGLVVLVAHIIWAVVGGSEARSVEKQAHTGQPEGSENQP